MAEHGDGSAAPEAAARARFEAARVRYYERLGARYQRVGLEILIRLTERGEHPAMLLGEVFVPQSVRADPPPLELPREVWRRLAEAGQIGALDQPEQLGRERLEQARRSYQARPARSVLDVLAGPAGRRLVLLGGPGAGKSTLARYLVLSLAGTTDGDPAGSATDANAQTGALQELAGSLPLLVELHTYADPRWRQGSFLDLIDGLYTSEDLGLPKDLLAGYLEAGGPAVVVFDGLDEIFDPKLRREITRRIEAFASRYRQIRVVVTSRV